MNITQRNTNYLNDLRGFLTPEIASSFDPANVFFCEQCGAETQCKDKLVVWNNNSPKQARTECCKDCAPVVASASKMFSFGTEKQNAEYIDNYYR